MIISSHNGVNPFKVPTGAIILTLDESGRCISDLSPEQIKRVDGLYGREIKAQGQLKDGDVMVFENPAVEPVYQYVIFVVDRISGPLSRIVGFALSTAESRKLESVNLPTMRSTWSAKKLPGEDATLQIVQALNHLERRGQKYLQRVRVMFHDDLSGPSRFDRFRKESVKVESPTPNR